MELAHSGPISEKGARDQHIPVAVIARTAFFLFASTTPALGLVGVGLTGLGFVALLFGWRQNAAGAAALLLAFLLLTLPMTVYDLSVSLERGFTTASFIGIPLFFVAGYVFSQSTGKFAFLDVFERAFFYLAVPSFVLFVIYVLRPDIVYGLPEYEFGRTINRTMVLLNVQMNPDPVLRNAGFASEPGFYQIFVNAALYARLRRLGSPDKISIFYLVLSLSSVSTTGIAVSFFLILVKFDIKYRLLVLLVILLFFGTAQEFLLGQYNAKIANQNVFGPRFLPTLNAFEVFKENPFGIGAVAYNATYERLDIGSWASYSQIALRYGLPGLVAFATLMTSVARRHPVLFGVLAISFITSPIWFLPGVAAFYFPTAREQEEEQEG